ncbi:MAG: L-serine ammonia-lyase, iron-sulfur-dependent subunit beta [Oscillospiraceae bacterium]
MNISVFDVVGPVMIGPSSSHTAGASRLARIAKLIVAEPFSHVSFGLSGSFARTYRGHGTDRALVAGALGLREDDERLANSFAIAESRGLTWDFYEAELDNLHENSVEMRFHLNDGRVKKIVGSSVGGGRILIHSFDGFQVEYTAQSSALILRQEDRPGVVSEVTKVLAKNGINIGVMRLSRRARGDEAFCVIEVDGTISPDIAKAVEQVDGILAAKAINLEQ